MRTMMAMSINQKLEDIKVSRYLMGWDSRNCVYVTELMDEEESGPLKTWLCKSQWVIERKQRLDVRVAEAYSDADDIW
jgi:hypothetical protein